MASVAKRAAGAMPTACWAKAAWQWIKPWQPSTTVTKPEAGGWGNLRRMWRGG
ncbi:MAG: hypothetical protein F6J87_02020 [Spirulina sp. SIO3F2]|nr:hypothetical protein [Spirulina sp. SIO3F2]